VPKSILLEMGHERFGNVCRSIPEYATAPCAEEESAMTLRLGDRQDVGGSANERGHDLVHGLE
jgi:hypothetical protein